MNGMILTTAGRNLLAKALTGKVLAFTKCMCGDGDLGNRDPASLTALISSKKELPIQSMNIVNSVGTSEVVVEMSNKGLSTGFFVREYGLFARDPDTQKEVLYSYCNKGSQAGYLEGDNGVDQINYVLSLVTVIDQAQNVTANITNSNQYVTVSRLEQKFTDLVAPYTAPQGFWTLSPSGDKRIRPASLEQARDVILQGVNVAGLNGRLERAEDAINQLWLLIETLQDFPGFSHFMAEDFMNTSMLDMFNSAVTSIVAGDDSIDVDPIAGMIPGSWYVITDGVRLENVRAESINLENGVQRVILESPVKNTYFLPSTIIYRTSAKVAEGTAIGPGARKYQEWTPDFTWQGAGASTDFSVPLNLTPQMSGSLVLSGSVVMGNDNNVGINA